MVGGDEALYCQAGTCGSGIAGLISWVVERGAKMGAAG